MGFCHVGQAGLKLLTSGDPLALASQSARITSVGYCAQPVSWFITVILTGGSHAVLICTLLRITDVNHFGCSFVCFVFGCLFLCFLFVCWLVGWFLRQSLTLSPRSIVV